MSEVASNLSNVVKSVTRWSKLTSLRSVNNAGTLNNSSVVGNTLKLLRIDKKHDA